MSPEIGNPGGSTRPGMFIAAGILGGSVAGVVIGVIRERRVKSTTTGERPVPHV
jgi:hypothetical protein